MNNYLLNENTIEDYPSSALGYTKYAPGEVILEYKGSDKDVAVPEGVKMIADKAFADCDTIEYATLPSSLVWIGRGAFSKCKNLKRIEIKDGIEDFDYDSFSGCSSLAEAILPNSLKDIPRGTFTNCTSLRSISIPDNVSWLWNTPFWNCSSLEHIHFGAQFDLTAKDFQDCSALKTFTVSENNEKITIIDNIVYSRDGKKLLLSRKDVEGCYQIPEGVEEIAPYAFANCLKLTEVIFPSTLYEIGSSAFIGCRQLTSVNIPANVKQICDNAFNRDNYGFMQRNNIDLPIMPYEKICIDPEAGSTYIGDNVFDFLLSPFDNSPLVLPEYPIGIVQKDRKVRFVLGYCLNHELYSGEYAKGYKKTAKLMRKKVLKEAEEQGLIEVKAFYDLLDSGELDKKAKQSGKAYSPVPKKVDDVSVQVIELKGVSITATEAKKSWKLDKCTYGQGYEACRYFRTETVKLFEYKGTDETVTVPSWVGKKPVSAIGWDTFRNNKTIKHIVIPEGIISIGDYAFEGCSNLESIVIEGSEINIGSSTFYGCSSLSSFVCKANKVKLGIHPFTDCDKLMNDDGLIILDFQEEKVLCGCKYPIQNPVIEIPDGVTRIDGHVFSYSFSRNQNIIADVVKKLRKVVIPPSVHTIAQNAFSAENLREVILPEGLKELGIWTFFNCLSLKELHMPASINSLSPAFIYNKDGSYIDTTLYAAEGSYVEEFVRENKKYGYKFAVEGS